MKTLFILNEAPYGSERSSVDALAQWTGWADKVLVF
jgi:sulfur relay (sulfurtransferase) DsrF/TusC family protein